MIEDRTGRIWAVRSRVRDNKGPLCEVEGNASTVHGKTTDWLPVWKRLAQDNAGMVWVDKERSVVGTTE
jgi:hypothetical protein